VLARCGGYGKPPYVLARCGGYGKPAYVLARCGGYGKPPYLYGGGRGRAARAHCTLVCTTRRIML